MIVDYGCQVNDSQRSNARLKGVIKTITVNTRGYINGKKQI